MTLRDGKRRGSAIPSFEGLEPRELLSGNVTASTAGGVLYVIGDAAANDVVVTSPSAGQLHLVGQNGTNLNGGTDAVDVTGVTVGTFVFMGSGGGDSVGFQGTALPGFLDIFAGSGDNMFTLGDGASVASFLNVFGASGNDTLAASHTTIGGGVTVVGGAGTNVVTFASSSIGGSLTVLGGAGRTALSLDATPVTGNLIVSNGFGAGRTSLTNSSVGGFGYFYNLGGGDLGGADAGWATSLIVSGGSFGGAVTVINVFGNDKVAFNALSVGGLFYNDNGPGSADVAVSGAIGGPLIIVGLGGSNGIQLGSADAACSASMVLILTGSSPDDVTLRGVSVSGDTTILTGDGSDTLAVDDSTFSGAFTLDAGSGNDTVTIEGVAGTSAPSTFVGPVRLALGSGNDTLHIGLGGDADANGHFESNVTTDGGSGTDGLAYQGRGNTFDQGVTLTDSNYETPVSAPSVTTSQGTTYSHGQDVVVDALLVVTQGNEANLTGATVTVTSGFHAGADVLNFVNQNGITGSWSPVTGVLTLTGTASAANYQTALRSITFSTLFFGNGTRTVSFVVTDSEGAGSAATKDVVVDLTAPSVAVTVADGQADPTNASPIHFTVTFSESVTGLTSDDLNLGGTAPGTLSAVVTGSGSTYDVAVSGMTGDGTVTVGVKASAVQDLAGNPSTASPADASVNYDITGPTVGVTADRTASNFSMIVFHVTFSENVTGFGSEGVTLGGTAGATGTIVVGSSGGSTYDIVVIGMVRTGTVTIGVKASAAQDLAGNWSTASPSDATTNYDITAPTVAVTVADGQSNPTNASTIHFTVTFSESVTGFSGSGVTRGGTAGVTTVVVTGSGTTYDVAVSGMIYDGVVTIGIGPNVAQDAAGNENTSAPSIASVDYDMTAPTVAVTVADGQASPTNASPIHFTVTFSESVTGFDTDDLTLGGTAPGTLSAVITGSGAVYDVAVSGMTDSGAVTLGVKADAVEDSSGNRNTASPSSASVTYDVTGPTVEAVVASGQASPTNGSPIHFTVTFSEDVMGFTTADLDLGGTAPGTRSAVISIVSYSLAGGPVATISARVYDVAVSGMTGPGTVTLGVKAGAVTDSLGNPSTASPSAASVDYDATAPTVSVTVPESQANPTNGSTIHFTVTFSEAVGNFTPDWLVLGGTAAGTLSALVAGSGTTYDVAVSGMIGDGTVTVGVKAGAATDAAGNSSEASPTDASVTYDRTAPTVSVVLANGQDNPTNAWPIHFTVTFSEPVTGFGADDLRVSGTAGVPTAVVTGSGTTYDVAITGASASGRVTMGVGADGATDAAGNGNTSSGNVSATYDVTAPTVSVAVAEGQSNPTSDSTIHFTVTFSEDVTGFASGDLNLGGTATGTLSAVVTGSGTTYDVAVSGMTGDGTVTVGVKADGAQDAAGNKNTASPSNASVSYDGTAPNVDVSVMETQNDPTNIAPVYFTVTFSESVTGFTSGDLALGGTAAGTLSAIVTGSGSSYTVAVSGMTGTGTVTVGVKASAAQDAVGNWSRASSSDASITYDVTAPTASVAAAEGQSNPTNGSTIHFTVTFSEDVTGFGTSDLNLGGTATGTLSAVITGSGTTYDVAVSGMTGSGTVTCGVKASGAQDAAGNVNTASPSSASVAYDVTAPTVRVTRDESQSSPTNESPLHFAVTFSESVTGFDTDDLNLGGTAPGTLSAVITGSGTTYDVAVSGMTAPGTVTCGIKASGAHDAAGNGNSASPSSASFTYDAVAPTVAVTAAEGQANPTNGSTIHFTVTFSEDVIGFDETGLTIGGTAGATTASVTGSGATYDVAVTGMTGSGTVTLGVKANAAGDLAGNGSTASPSSASVTYDVTAPTVSVVRAAAQSDPTSNLTIHFTVTFSEDVTGFSSAGVVLGGSSLPTTAEVTGSGSVYDVAVSGMLDPGSVTVGIAASAAQDAVGNPSEASTSDASVTYGPLTATIDRAEGQVRATNDSSLVVHYVVTFSGSSTDLTASGIFIGNSAATGTPTVTVTKGAGYTYNVAIAPDGSWAEGDLEVGVNANAVLDSDSNGNLISATAMVTFDYSAPLVDALPAEGQADPTGDSPIHFTVTFNENVTGFDADDLNLGGTAGATTMEVTGSGSSYDVAVSGMTGDGTVTLGVKGHAAADAAGNWNALPVTPDASVTYSTIPDDPGGDDPPPDENFGPTASVELAAGQSEWTSTSPIYFYVTFSEDVTGFDANDVVLSGTAGATTAVVTGSGYLYTVAVSGMAQDGTVIVSVPADAALDTDNYGNQEANVVQWAHYDTTAPTVTVAAAEGQGSPTYAESVHFTVTFSEDVTGFDDTCVTLGGTANASVVEVTGSGTTYDLAVSGMESAGTVTVSIAAHVVQDLTGFWNSAAPSSATVSFLVAV